MQKQYCDECGHKVPEGEIFCPKCGGAIFDEALTFQADGLSEKETTPQNSA